jgi:hypothetical protein
MLENKKLVAISLEQDQVFLVKSVSEQEYKKMLNKQHECESESERQKVIHIGQHNELGNRLTKLEKKNLILAKSIYDNFVDRGLLENDEQFQKDWFDFYFNSCELSLENAPQEYKQILEKVGNF